MRTGRPKVKGGKPVTFKLTEKQWKDLRKFAKSKGATLTDTIIMALEFSSVI